MSARIICETCRENIPHKVKACPSCGLVPRVECNCPECLAYRTARLYCPDCHHYDDCGCGRCGEHRDPPSREVDQPHVVTAPRSS